jgi:cytochrome c oxidase cbb3-type subunit 3
VGPNLTDDNWKNVTKLEDIAKVIEVGAANGSMPAWRNRLSHVNLIVLTSAYVASLRGTNPANPKAPEGNPIPPWPTGTPASSGSQ